jgi:hypothetical protein
VEYSLDIITIHIVCGEWMNDKMTPDSKRCSSVRFQLAHDITKTEMKMKYLFFLLVFPFVCGLEGE